MSSHPERSEGSPSAILSYIPFTLIGCCWGCSYIAIKFVIAAVPPFLGAELRVLISLTILLVIGIIFRQPLTVPRTYRWKVWLTGLFFLGIPMAFLFWGERLVPSALAGIINGTTPLWTFLMAMIFIRQDEKFTYQKLAGLLLGFVGMAFIFWPRIALPHGSGEMLGMTAITLMAVSYGGSTILNRLFLSGSRQLPSYGIMVQQHLSSLVFLALLSFFVEGKPDFSLALDSSSAMTALLYLSTFSTSLSWIAFFYLLKKWGSVRTIAATYIIPIVAVIADYVAFGKIPKSFEMLGMAIILAGVMLVQFSNHRKSSRLISAQVS